MDNALIPARDIDFLLWDWLQLGRLLEREDFASHDRPTVDAFLELSQDIARDLFLPHYKAADEHEPSLDAQGDVHVLPAIIDALSQYSELGFCGAGFPETLGGMQFPSVVVSASMAQFMAASIATSGYPMLTAGNARLITKFGTPEQIDIFARPQIEGRTFGTMCLSEPQAGSSLADIRTRAVPDGHSTLGPRYRLTGNKMWISGGDQDITANIVHLVLAKVMPASGELPEGTSAISLFIVPKFLPDDGARNDVAVAGLNHKMGYRGTANCLLNLGEGRQSPEGKPGAVGYLVGAQGQGLALMFQMMNEARIQVGLGAAALGYRGYRHSVAYARDRTQGRALGGRKTDRSPPIPIIGHPDVQHMLLAQKSYAEGALALVLYCAMLVDREDEEGAAELLALLTPIAKTWPSEWGLAANDLAIQIHGGYGYTRDFDVEQVYRDNRLNPIHEGTTGVQALDLLGRKILRSNDEGLTQLKRRITQTVLLARKHRDLALWAFHVEGALAELDATVEKLRSAPAHIALANATAFLRGFGHIVVAWLWLDQALCCQGLAAPDGADPFLAGKARACRYFIECELPKATTWLRFAASLSDVAIDVPVDQF